MSARSGRASMNASASFLAEDLGASSVRVMDCRWDRDRFSLEDIHRFPNGGERFDTSLHCDVLRIWSGIHAGLKKFRTSHSDASPGTGINALDADYCLPDKLDRLFGNPRHSRPVQFKSYSPAHVSAWRETFECYRSVVGQCPSSEHETSSV